MPAAHPELGSDPFVPQRCRQLRPVAAAGYGVAQRVENFIFRFVRFAQAVLLDILFARCEVEPMPDGQLLAESLRTVAVVAVGDGTAVVVHPVEKDMQMGMFPVAVAGDDELRVSDAHAGEILRGDSDHPPVVEPCGVLCEKARTMWPTGFERCGFSAACIRKLRTMESRSFIRTPSPASNSASFPLSRT